MNIFQEVKNSVTVTAAAEAYGLTVSRGKALCPFHNDSHPSLFIHEKYFHCFVCDSGGDVIAFVARLFGLSPTNAAKKLCADFGLHVSGQSSAYSHGKIVRQIEERKKIDEWSGRMFLLLCFNLKKIDGILHAREESDELHSALENISRTQYFADLFTYADSDGRKELYKKHREEVEMLASKTY